MLRTFPQLALRVALRVDEVEDFLGSRGPAKTVDIVLVGAELCDPAEYLEVLVGLARYAEENVCGVAIEVDSVRHLNHRHTGAEDVLCNCGARGCVEAAAAVPAMLKRLEAAGLADHDTDLRGSDLLAHLLRGRDPHVTQVVREGAEKLGEVVATLCNVLNPRRVVITSALASVSHDVLAGVRSVVYQRARALATKDLVIDYSTLGDDVGIAGAYLIGRRYLLAATNIKQLRVAPAA